MQFVPPSRASLRQPATLVPLEDITSPRIRTACEELLVFAGGKTAPQGATKPKRLVGVAANQVGVDLAFAYVNVARGGEWTDELRLLINPRIVRTWGEDEPVDWWHGCYSTGDLITIRSLPRFMEIEFYDAEGRRCEWVIDGKTDGMRQLHVVRHEIDHLLGVRHVDVAIEAGRPIYVVYPQERGDFNTLFLENGNRLYWHRTLPPEGWQEMLGARAWRYLIVEAGD